MLDKVGKVAVIHSTGTGKSMIAFRQVETHPDAQFLWLAPSTYIYHTQLKNLQRMIGDSDTESLLEHVTFMTYSKLMRDEDSIDNIQPDYIILDEFHRCGAKEWGRSVTKLLEAHSAAKLLGLSATSIRYLDNQRDMAQELFDGCIASEMTLGEAIARGILPTPKYVVGMFSYDDEIKKLQQKIKAFATQSDVSKNMKLLYCIDMLNEGGHVDDIDGVILLRPTVSPIIYMQQIGRCLAAGDTEKPVIFDMVDNFESLYSIDVLREEIDEAFSIIPCTYGERKRFKEPFEIYDALKDCMALFSELQNSLSSSWDNYYLAACAYYKEHGDLKVIKNYVTQDGLTLGAWNQTQRRIYNGSITGNLTADKIEKLNLIGMVWNVNGGKFSHAYEELKLYHDTYGNLDIKARYISPSGFLLGKWVNNLRHSVKKHGIDFVLDKEQQEKLNELGMIYLQGFEEAC